MSRCAKRNTTQFIFWLEVVILNIYQTLINGSNKALKIIKSNGLIRSIIHMKVGGYVKEFVGYEKAKCHEKQKPFRS